MVIGRAGALGRLIDDDALARRLGDRARRRTEQEFSLDAVGARLDELLNGSGGVQNPLADGPANHGALCR